MLQIPPELQKFLEESLKLDYVISVNVLEPPQALLNQVEFKECFYLDYVVKSLHGDADSTFEIAFLVPQELIHEESYTEVPFEQLFGCTCSAMDGSQSEICGHSPYYNTGKTTYLVRYPDRYLVRLVDIAPELIIIPKDNLKILVDKLSQIPKVNAIKVETIVDESLKQSLGDNSVMIRAYIDINNDKILDHSVCFTVTELVYETESGHDWAVNNLIDLIEQNNAK